MAIATVRNGVNVDQLVQTINAIKGDANVAAFTFRAKTRWAEGSTSSAEMSSFLHAGRHQSHSRNHVLTGCEPEVLLGRDNGPNAVELVLAALGFCYSVGFVYNAAAMGYELEELEYEVEGDLDLRNFVGLEGGSRPGFTEIRVRSRARSSNASEEQLQELCRYVQDTSPVKDIIANPVPVNTSLEVID